MARSKTCLPQQGQSPVIERDQDVEIGPFPCTAEEIGSLPTLDDHLSALGGVLGQIATRWH